MNNGIISIFVADENESNLGKFRFFRYNLTPILQLLLQWSVFDLVCAQLVEILFNGGNYLEKMAA